MALANLVTFVVFRILGNLISMEKFLMQITADVSEILKTIQRGLTFIFNILSESIILSA